MRIRPYHLFATLLCGAAACSEQPIEGPAPIDPSGTTAKIEAIRNTPESRALPVDEPLFVGFDTATPAEPATRTTLEADWVTTKWSPTDRIAVWAADNAGNSVFSGVTFRRNNQIAENAAIFTGDLSPMAAGRYRYFACYPVPDTDRIEGSRVTYALPAVQDGTYRPEYDVLTSDIAEGGSLTDNTQDEQIRVAMHHRFHALRIRIPSGRNRRGAGVTRLLIDFPHEAAGTATFDLEHPEAAPVLTNGSRRIDLRFEQPFDESTAEAPQYVWVFVAPGVVDGPISFTPLFEDGFCSETLSTSVSKTMCGGHVTPVNLTVSAVEQPVTWLDFAIDHSQLGEPVNTLQVEAPEGAYFRNNASTAALPVSNGKCSVGYYGILCAEAFRGARLALSYDSEHAVTTNTLTLPASLNEEAHNAFSLKVPWLFFEDFGGITDFNADGGHGVGNPKATNLASANLPGWFGARVEGSAGTSVRLRQNGNGFAYYPARLDSAPLVRLKNGASVRVRVLFKADANGASVSNCRLQVGTGRSDGNFSGDDGINTVETLNIGENGSASYTDIRGEYSYEIASADRNTTLAWQTLRKSGWVSGRTNYWLDDIRVSIVQ